MNATFDAGPIGDVASTRPPHGSRLRCIRRFMSALAALCALASGARAATLEVTPHWKVGERVAYEFTKSRDRIESGTVQHAGTATTDMTVTVLEASDDGYLVDWTFGETRLDSPLAGQSPAAVQLFASLANMLKGARLTLRLDRDAQIREVVNWQDYKAFIERACADMLKGLTDGGVPAEQARQILGTVQVLYASEPDIRSSLHEQQLFSSAYGDEYEPGVPIVRKGPMSLPWGLGTVEAVMRATLVSAGEDDGQIRVEWSQTLDPESVRAATLAMMQKLTANLAKRPAAGDMPTRIEVSDEGAFAVDKATGWVLHARQTRTTSAGDAAGKRIVQRETLEFQRK